MVMSRNVKALLLLTKMFVLGMAGTTLAAKVVQPTQAGLCDTYCGCDGGPDKCCTYQGVTCYRS